MIAMYRQYAGAMCQTINKLNQHQAYCLICYHTDTNSIPFYVQIVPMQCFAVQHVNKTIHQLEYQQISSSSTFRLAIQVVMIAVTN